MTTTKEIIESATLPVYTVHGSNWQVNVPIDEFNAQFSDEMQMMEACARAIEAFKGINSDLFLQLDEGEETPYIGPTLLVYLEGSNPAHAVPVPTYVVLADCGFYEDSKAHQEAFKKEIEAIEEEEDAELKRLVAQLKKHGVFNKKKTQKPRKKKS